jgi:1,4-dihydroxy-2-naphthoate polyprenyltransferase
MALVASFAQWIEGARPRTLPNAVSPVIAGTGAAAWLHAAVWWKALLALLVAVAMIIGVNFANDYSDGIRGTDDVRAGPLRLVGSRLASPRSVLAAAVASLAVGAVAGLVLALASAPWLIAVGAVCIAGAWLYTGGSKPYGYLGLGEIAVFVFFGLVAVLGTQYTQALRADWVGLALAVAMGSLSSAVLVANNLRDIPTDAQSGKITLAVRLGDARTRLLYQGLLLMALLMTVALMFATPWCAVGLVAAPLAVRAARPVRGGLVGKDLIPVLRDTGLTMLVWAVVVALALTFGGCRRWSVVNLCADCPSHRNCAQGVVRRRVVDLYAVSTQTEALRGPVEQRDRAAQLRGVHVVGDQARPGHARHGPASVRRSRRKPPRPRPARLPRVR